MQTKPKYISHIKQLPNESWDFQSNEEHCEGVAKLAEQFANDFNMGHWGRILGLLHDKGKEKEDFQNYIMKASGYEINVPAWNNKDHAYVGALNANQLYGQNMRNLLVNQIAGHHTGLYDYTELNANIAEVWKMPNNVKPITEKERLEIPFKKSVKEDFHHISRMLYSCLVDADYLDTEAFMQPESSKLRGGKASLAELLPKLNRYLTELKINSENTEVNGIRQQIQKQCNDTSELGKGFYSLTVPTGGGKTLSSLLWAMRHAVHNEQERIIIAIPYTSIIVQTAGKLKEIFGEENVLEHHSNVNPENIKNEELQEQMRLAMENWDYPIIVTTNVQLVESLFSNKPSDCRKLHNIVNSVLILDEVQTLPTDFLQPIVDTLKTYQQLFGVSILFTTASQPILSGLIEGCNPRSRFQGISYIKEIIPTEWQLHDKLRRVRLDINNDGRTYNEIAEMLMSHDRVLCIVNTRKDAYELFTRLPDEGKLHLSRMMCPDHVRENIDKIKTSLQDKNQKVLRVITTQLVEAGVDIDFPVVYRQESGLDSILQAAGRCNREGHNSISTTYVFSLSKEHPLPPGSLSASNYARKNLLGERDWFAPETMTEYFHQLYCRVSGPSSVISGFDRKNMKHYLYNPMELMLKTAAQEFRLIDDNSIPVIINWKNSLELVEQLKTQGVSYSIIKKLSNYTVNIRQNDFKHLFSAGQIDEIKEGTYVIYDHAQYNCNVGLLTDNHWLDEILIK